MKVTQKIIATIILISIIFSIIAPVVMAISDSNMQFKTEEDILYEKLNDIESDEAEKLNNETYAQDKEENITSFDVLMANVLTKKEGNSFKINDVPSIILQKSSKTGIWIEENSREYVVNLINSTTNKVYKIDEDGFLVLDSDTTKELTNEEFKEFTQKIDKMISETKLIVIAIVDKYKELNNIDNEIIDIEIDDDDYALQFKDNTEEEQNKEDIIILNQKHYSFENKEDNGSLLMYKLLENYKIESDEQTEINNTEEDFANETEDIESKIEHINPENIFDDRVSESDFNLILVGIG